MPELPDIVVYLETLSAQLVGRPLRRVRLMSPFVLRSIEPPLDAVADRQVAGLSRIGKRIVFSLGDDLFIVLHLMIAGRLRWREPGQKPGVGPRMLLALFDFDHGTLLFTEAGSSKRASMHVVRGAAALAAFDAGGVEPLDADFDTFLGALSAENHTLKRALTDPRLFSGIGNAYSDEILHAARLSPMKLTRTIAVDEARRLYESAQTTLRLWIDRLRDQAHGRVPEKVTAFHEQMAVHGRFKLPCPVCGTPVQRIVYAENECNYCAVCQTGGKLLADRALSRLLREDWPRRIDDL